MDPSERKRAIRAAWRDAGARLAPEDLATDSHRACARVASLPEFARARVVMAYAALPGEASADALIDAAIRAGKIVALPRVDWAHGTLGAARIDQGDGADPSRWRAGLVAGRNGVLQPVGDLAGVPAGDLAPSDLDLIVVPGVAFDSTGRGTRIGRGAGFYDRFLSGPARAAFRVGLALEAQLGPDLPAEPWDAPLDAVATPIRVIRTDRSIHP